MTIEDHDGLSEHRTRVQGSCPRQRSGPAEALSWAAGSALCSVACILSAVGCLIVLMVQPSVWILALLALPVLFAMAARKCDRAKMRILYGAQLGDVLHASTSASSARELAQRDFLFQQALPETRSSRDVAVGSQNSKILSLREAVDR